MSDSSSVIRATDFNRQLFHFTEKLAVHDLVASNIECKWGLFGSWIVEFEDGQSSDRYGQAVRNGQYDVWGPKVLRILWDGRERELTISESPTPPLSGPNQWTVLLNESVADSASALNLAEEFAQKWQRA